MPFRGHPVDAPQSLGIPALPSEDTLVHLLRDLHEGGVRGNLSAVESR